MNKIKNTKGFTLMEMLIVVAIIAVLVAIAIPTFTTSLNKARVATDEANIRSGYASVMAKILTEQISTEGKTGNTATGNAEDAIYVLLVDGTVKKQGDTTIKTEEYKTKGKAATKDNVNIAGFKFTSWESGQSVTYEYKGDKNEVTEIAVGTSKGTKATATP